MPTGNMLEIIRCLIGIDIPCSMTEAVRLCLGWFEFVRSSWLESLLIRGEAPPCKGVYAVSCGRKRNESANSCVGKTVWQSLSGAHWQTFGVSRTQLHLPVPRSSRSAARRDRVQAGRSAQAAPLRHWLARLCQVSLTASFKLSPVEPVSFSSGLHMPSTHERGSRQLLAWRLR